MQEETPRTRQLYAEILTWQDKRQVQRITNQHSDDHEERLLGKRLADFLLRRSRAIGPGPAKEKLNPADVALVNRIPGVPARGCSTTEATATGSTNAFTGVTSHGKKTKRPQAHPPPNESCKRQRTSTSDSHSNAVTLCLRGLNIQWPFSQLILLGAKTDEVRGYDLGYRKICSKDEEVWIVETKGPSMKDAAQAAQAIVGDSHIGSRPAAAQIVGTVSFSKSCLYRDQQAFHDAKHRHRIAIGSKKDWDGIREKYRWLVGKVRSLATPVPVETGQTGFDKRPYSVVFAAPTGDDHNDCRPLAKEGSRGCSNGQEASASSSSSVGNNGAAGHPAPFQRQA